MARTKQTRAPCKAHRQALQPKRLPPLKHKKNEGQEIAKAIDKIEDYRARAECLKDQRL